MAAVERERVEMLARVVAGVRPLRNHFHPGVKDLSLDLSLNVYCEAGSGGDFGF
jgi:hypothetical protein